VKEDIKTKWVNALRTGVLPDGTPIKQAEGVLRRLDDNGVRPLCCLGVLSEIAVLEDVIPAPRLDEHNPSKTYDWYYMAEDAYTGAEVERAHWDEDLSPAVQEWAGLNDSNPDVPFEGDLVRLSVLNDEMNQKFEDIANLVEEYL
jgi:hypothetical protein